LLRPGEYAEKFSGHSMPAGVAGRAPEESPWKDGDRGGGRPVTTRQQVHREPAMASTWNMPPAAAALPVSWPLRWPPRPVAERPPGCAQDPPSSQADAVTDGGNSADAKVIRSAQIADYEREVKWQDCDG
jgi:hypothetical protein